MGIRLARIDNRLLHGIVASQWAPSVGAVRVMIIDDDVANDELKKGSMRLAKPAGCALSIIPYETALNNFKANKYEGQSIFLIVKEPVTILKLQEAGILVEKLNVGSTAKKDNEIVISKQVSVTKEELEIYKQIMDRGTEINVQYILADPVIPMKNYLR